MRSGRKGFAKSIKSFCLIGVIALGLITIIATCGGDGGSGGGGDDGDTSFPGNPVGGVLLQGNPNDPASTALYDYDSGDRFGSAEVITDSNGAELVRTKIEIAFSDIATIGEINALLDSIEATITSMLEGVNLLVVRMADPGSLAGLDDVISQVETDPGVLYVTKLYLPVPRELPDNYTAGTSDLTLIDHHLAIRAHAAWNARAALNDPFSDPPLLIVEDSFGGGSPNGDFDVTRTMSDFAFGTSPSPHGYHVLGVISAAYGGDSSARGLATGICPGTLELRAVDYQTTGLDAATGENKLLSWIKNSNKNVIVNSSMGFGNLTCGTLLSECVLPYARSWIKRVRGSTLYNAGTTGPESLENKFLHFSAAGNIGVGPDNPEAALDSNYNAARLMTGLETETSVSLDNLNNTLVIENRFNSADQPYKPACLMFSKYPGDLSAIGEDVYSLTGSSVGAGNFGGTSMASPQAAGLAAYVWALAPGLTPQELLWLLKATARDYGSCAAPTPQPVIDAYSAVLAVDDASALEEGGSEVDAPVRFAILDVADANGDLGGNGIFDAKDIEYFLQAYSIETSEPDYSRCDLNGDGYTGGAGTDRFNLDIDYPPTYGTVTQEILGQTVTFIEETVTDMQVICYYAYSPLYTGDTTMRDLVMKSQINKCGVVPLDGGGHHSMYYLSENLYGWGRNNYGQLGDGSGLTQTSPVAVFNGDVIDVAAGRYHTLVALSDGSVWGWGSNSSYQLALELTSSYFLPQQITSISDVVDVTAGWNSSVALKKDGTVWEWGEYVNTPQEITFPHEVIAIAAGGNHRLALEKFGKDTTVWAWGDNGLGQLGDGSTTYRDTPVMAGMSEDVVAIAGGNNHSLALTRDLGQVYAWGVNENGELGTASSGDCDGHACSKTPVLVSGNLTGIIAIAASPSGSHSLALRNDGTVWAWGYNGRGQLGDGTTDNRSAPVQVCDSGSTTIPCTTFLTDVVAIAAGQDHSLALKNDGTLWAWGDNLYGELGNGGSGSLSTLPVQVF